MYDVIIWANDVIDGLLCLRLVVIRGWKWFALLETFKARVLKVDTIGHGDMFLAPWC